MTTANGILDALALGDIGAAQVSLPGVYNRKVACTLKWRKAVGDFTDTGARPKLLLAGDSKYVNAITASPSNAEARSLPQRIAGILTAKGMPAVCNAWFGTSGFGTVASKIQYDARLAGFSSYSRGVDTLGGKAMFTSTIGDAAKFTPRNIVDRYDVYTRANNNDATFTLTEGATVLATVDGNVSQRLVKTTVPVTRGLTEISFQKLSGAGGNNLIGMVGWDSTIPQIEVVGAGISGSTSADWVVNASPWSVLPTVSFYAPTMTLIGLLTNDQGASVSVATAIANLQALITAAKVSGDVILTWRALNTVSAPYDPTTSASFRAALLNLAVANDCIFVDFDEVLGGYAAINASNIFQAGDLIHEGPTAVAVEARVIANLLASL